MDFSERFSGKAQDYIRYRPKYPAAMRDLLILETGLLPTDCVADIGSGTGISSEIFTENGNTVYAVEPNDDMRNAAEMLFRDEPKFISIKGSAEHTTLADKSIDLVFAGTAFHWFDIPETRKEFNRILKNDGHIVISWNHRDLESPLQKKLEEIIGRHLEKIKKAENQKEGKSIKEFFGDQEFKHTILKNTQQFTFPELMGRMRSSSYFPPKQDALYNILETEITEVFRTFEHNGKINFNYKTHIYWV